MTRRLDHQAIYVARRYGTRNRLIGEGLPEELAEGWVAAWEQASPSSATDRQSNTFWIEGWNWIAAQRATRRAP